MNLHRFVRIAEVAVLVVLGGFALVTWIELDSLRKAPVALPNYAFEATTGPDGIPVVTTRGTWFAQEGPPEPLLTTTIECRKDKMECVESTALVVFVSGKGLLEAQQTVFPVERWTAQELVTRPVQGPCAARQLILDLDETSRRQILSGSRSAETGGRGEALPSLGGDAKRVDPSSVRSSRSPFPTQGDGGPTGPAR